MTQNTQTTLRDIAMLQLCVVPHHQGHGRSRLEYAIGITVSVTTDFGTLWIWCIRIDTGQGQGDRVAVTKVQRCVVDKYRVVCADLIQHVCGQIVWPAL